MAPLVGEHGLSRTRASVVVARGVQSSGSVLVAPGLSCSEATQVFPDQGLNPDLLPWQVNSLPLSHQASLRFYLF